MNQVQAFHYCEKEHLTRVSTLSDGTETGPILNTLHHQCGHRYICVRYQTDHIVRSLLEPLVTSLEA